MILGLDVVIWIVLVVYFVAMLGVGWWSKKLASSREGYLLGNRRFGVGMMVMHAFGAGTNPGDAAGVISKSSMSGASGIWVSWMWLFGTPFYWLIAPIIRQLRCLTMADFYEKRFGRIPCLLYIVIASVGMTVCLASVLLATASTVLGMMGKAGDPASNTWFISILLTCTFTFMIYGYWGGIVAAVRTDMIQGIMIIILSFLAIPAALSLQHVEGFAGLKDSLASLGAGAGKDYLSLTDPATFDWVTVLLLCINAPICALAFPHLVSITSAGKTAWEGRMGITYGNMLKRFCTIGWCLLGLCWLVHLTQAGTPVTKEIADSAFGDLVRATLPPFLQGLMLSCVMAAAMSSGDAFQVTVAGLFSENIYRGWIRPNASEEQTLRVTKITGLVIVLLSLLIAVLMRDVVKTIMDYFNILSLVGLSAALGIVWRRMNGPGMLVGTALAVVVFLVTRYGLDYSRAVTIGLPLLAGVIGGVIGSLVTRPPDRKAMDDFYKKIYTPIGQEDRLELPIDEAIPADRRLCTAAGFFVVKPSRQTWIGFLVATAICLAVVGTMMMLLA